MLILTLKLCACNSAMVILQGAHPCNTMQFELYKHTARLFSTSMHNDDVMDHCSAYLMDWMAA